MLPKIIILETLTILFVFLSCKIIKTRKYILKKNKKEEEEKERLVWKKGHVENEKFQLFWRIGNLNVVPGNRGIFERLWQREEKQIIKFGGKQTRKQLWELETHHFALSKWWKMGIRKSIFTKKESFFQKQITFLFFQSNPSFFFTPSPTHGHALEYTKLIKLN